MPDHGCLKINLLPGRLETDYDLPLFAEGKHHTVKKQASVPMY